MAISDPPLSASRNVKFLAVANHLSDDVAGFKIKRFRSARHRHDKVFPISAVGSLFAAASPVTGALQGLEVEGLQGVDINIGPKKYVPAPPAVPAVRTSERHEFFASKGGQPIPPVSGKGGDFHPVSKCGEFGHALLV